MMQDLKQNWRQALMRWYDILRQASVHGWPRRQASVQGEPGWFASQVISGGSVHTVEETEAEVIIIATFPRLALTQVTMEMAGDRLLIQGKTPRRVSPSDTWPTDTRGRYDVRIRSAVLPCAVDLTHARMIRKHDTVQITVPKKTEEPLQRGKGKEQGIG
jgi:HSP20 family molecular chaperone IbpA